MKSVLLLLSMTLAVSPGISHAEMEAGSRHCAGHSCFSASADVGGTKIPLRGLGLLEFLKVDLYSAAFYVPEEAKSFEQVLGNVPKSLMIEYHRNIKVEWMLKAARKALMKNPEVDFAAIESRVDQISKAYKKVRRGDRYELRYVPGNGTSLYLNGELQITIPGEDFARAYLGIWISRHALNGALRDKLLALDRPQQS